MPESSDSEKHRESVHKGKIVCGNNTAYQSGDNNKKGKDAMTSSDACDVNVMKNNNLLMILHQSKASFYLQRSTLQKKLIRLFMKKVSSTILQMHRSNMK